MQFIEEAKKRRADLQRELSAIDKFLAFYEEESGEPLSPGMTLQQAIMAKRMSVRLANALHASADFEGLQAEEFTLGKIRDTIGHPITDEAAIRLMKMPNVGRKALNELRDLLGRIQQ